MGLNADALTTVAACRTFLRQPSADQTLLEDLINAYSKAIQRYCQREFKSKLASPDGQTRTFRWNGRRPLSFRPYEARSVTSIVLDTDYPAQSQTTLTSPYDYVLEPGEKTEEATYLWATIRPIDVSGRSIPSMQVSVTGNWGAGTTPEDVELACKIAVANGFRNPEAFQSRSLGELSFTEVAEVPEETLGRSLPPDARGLLTPFLRIGF